MREEGRVRSDGGGMEGGERGRDVGERKGEGWRGHGVVWSKGGMGSRAHSLELTITCVVIVTCVLVVACVHSWALAIICEPQ